MTLDREKLLAFAIPRGRQTVTPELAAFYALSIGFGQDPLDCRQLEYVDPARPLKVVPAMALVLAHPGFWLADPESGVDATGVLHADQAVEILGPLPTNGDVVSETRITGLVDKGPQKAALLRTETLVETAEGVALARLTRTTYVRNGGGFGGDDAAPSPLPAPPERAPDQVIDLPTRPEQALLYRLNGDLNPLHADPAVAQRAKFERPILHGLCTAGIVCHALLRALADYEERRLTGFRLRFAGTVIPGETIRTEIWSDGSFLARVVERDAIVIDGGRANIVAALSY